MPTVDELTGWRDALLRARYAGTHMVEYEGKRVVYKTDAEMLAALGDLERRLAAARGQRVTQVQINGNKGV